MTLSPDVAALRTSAGISRPGTTLLALRGEDARDALLHLLPSRLLLRDAQVRESLLLDEGGRPIADVLVACDDEDSILLVEGLSPEALREHIESHLPSGLRPEIEDLSATHESIAVDGPWAWWLVARVLGEDMVALPYLNFFRVDPGLCLRAGKTGEYGYELIVRREEVPPLLEALAREGAPLEVREVGAAARPICRFENGFFDPAHVPTGVTPLELQLGWRLDMERSWVGSEAVAARRAAGVERRLITMVAAAEVAAGSSVTLDGETIGEVVRAERSEARGEWVVAALLDVAYAHGGIVRYRAEGVPVRTVAPPLIDNHSLYIDPRRHTWEARDEIELGPLARGPRAPEAP